MNLAEFLSSKNLKPSELARRIGCSKSYISHVLNDGRHEGKTRHIGRPAALRIWREFNVKVHPIAHLTDDELRLLERMSRPPDASVLLHQAR